MINNYKSTNKFQVIKFNINRINNVNKIEKIFNQGEEKIIKIIIKNKNYDYETQKIFN